MKLLLSAYGCDPTRGSEYGNGWNWAKNLAGLGYEVWCLTTPRGKAGIEATMATEDLENLHFEFIEVPDWVDRTYVNAFGVMFHYLVWQHYAYKRAKELDQSVGFDIVHHVTYGSLKFASEMWKLKKPFIFGPVGGGQFAPKAFKKYFFKWWKNERIRSWANHLFFAFNPNLKKTMKRANHVLATNRETYEVMKRKGAANPQLFLDCSLPQDFFPESLPVRNSEGPLKILWVGRILAIKGLPLVLEALSLVPEDVDYELTVVGDGPLSHQMDHWLEMYGVADRVNWVGRIPWTEVKAQYRDHDMFMFATLRDSSPAQLMEAMAYGLPILTLDLHGSGFMVPDAAGIKVPAIKPEETVVQLADAVTRLYRDPELRKEYGKAGFEFASTQTWEVKIQRISQLYREMVPNGDHPTANPPEESHPETISQDLK